MKNPGYIYQFPDGNKAIAYHKEQRNDFNGRVLLHLFDRDFNPIISEKTSKQAVKFVDKDGLRYLKFIGFND